MPGAPVRILVSDNGSTDDTTVIVAARQDREPRLDYRRNERNLGATRNILEIIRHARTEYLWLFGDDDLPAPGALRRVLQLIEETRAVTYHLSAGQVKTPGPMIERDRLLSLCNRYGFLDLMGCLPAQVMRLDGLRRIQPDRHLTGVFLQSTMPFEAYAQETSVLVREPLIVYPDRTAEEVADGQARWTTEGTLFGYFKIIDVIEGWFHDGVLTEKLETGFFHSDPNYLWDRFSIIAFQSLLFGRRAPTAEMQAAPARLAMTLRDEAARRELIALHQRQIDQMNAWIVAHNALMRTLAEAEAGRRVD